MLLDKIYCHSFSAVVFSERDLVYELSVNICYIPIFDEEFSPRTHTRRLEFVPRAIIKISFLLTKSIVNSLN